VMQEKQVTIADDTLKVDRPFLVLATENPVEQEGAYRLPEAQLDRFMLKVLVGYNTLEEEFEIVNRVAKNGFEAVSQAADKKDLDEIKARYKEVHVDDAVQKYMLKLIFATREPEQYGLGDLKEFIEFGASPRGSIDLYKASRAHALLNGKDFVTPLNVAEVLFDVLRHRIILSYKAEAKGINSDHIIKKVLEAVKAP